MGNVLRTTIGQFSVLDGQVQTRAANAWAVEPAPDVAGAQRGKLYMLIEAAGKGGGHAALYRQVLNAAQVAFYEAEGTLASALTRSVRAAHAALRRINESSPESGWRGGISCVALNGQELTIAQAGPTLVLVSHPRTVEQFPPELDPSALPLGGPERPDVRLSTSQVEAGTIILLAESTWLRRVAPQTLAAAATAESVKQAVEFLGQLASGAELSALIVSVTDPRPVLAETEPGLALLSSRHPPPLTDAGDGPAAGSPVLARSGSGLLGWAKRAPQTSPQPGPRSGQQEPVRLEPVPTYSPDEADREELRVASPPVRDQLAEPRRSRFPLVLALVVIPVIVVLLVLGAWYLRGRQQETDFTDSISGASSAIASAQGLPDEVAARQRLSAARDFLDRASALKPADPRLAPVQAQLEESLARVNHVTPLYGGVPLWEFTESGHQPSRVLVAGNSLYVLDRGRQEISHFILSELRDSVVPADPRVIVKKGAQVNDLVVSDLVDVTWVDAVSNQRSRLVAVDTAGGLIGFDVTWGATRLPLAGRDKWGYPALIAGYGGNLYVVDNKVNQIWRYRPGDKGYENAPEPYFAKSTDVDLAGVQSVAIDGNIWLLYADGRVLKFFAGEQVPFELAGLPDRMNAPTSIAASLQGDQLYIADSGNSRILEFNKAGKFTRQLRPAQGDMLKGMRGLFLDEPGSAFFIVTADKMYKAQLPKIDAAVPASVTSPVSRASPTVRAATPTPGR